MILIADSGSTKTDWRLIVSQNDNRSYSTNGLNPYFLKHEEITNELEKELVPYISNSKIRALFFYGAGCGTSEKISIVEEGLRRVFNHTDIYIFSDILGAARALCNNLPGIVSILGTGSNSCLFDGTNIVSNQPSLGYIIGDEGSGAHLGKCLLSEMLSNSAPADATQLFNEYSQIPLSELLDKIYKRPFPNRFLASFTVFIHHNINNPFFYNLVKKSFSDFIDRNILKYKENKQVPIHFTGSVAYYFQDILKQCLGEKNLTCGQILKSPIDELIGFHQNDWKKYASLMYYNND